MGESLRDRAKRLHRKRPSDLLPYIAFAQSLGNSGEEGLHSFCCKVSRIASTHARVYKLATARPCI